MQNLFAKHLGLEEIRSVWSQGCRRDRSASRCTPMRTRWRRWRVEVLRRPQVRRRPDREASSPNIHDPSSVKAKSAEAGRHDNRHGDRRSSPASDPISRLYATPGHRANQWVNLTAGLNLRKLQGAPAFVFSEQKRDVTYRRSATDRHAVTEGCGLAAAKNRHGPAGNPAAQSDRR